VGSNITWVGSIVALCLGSSRVESWTRDGLTCLRLMCASQFPPNHCQDSVWNQVVAAVLNIHASLVISFYSSIWYCAVQATYSFIMNHNNIGSWTNIHFYIKWTFNSSINILLLTSSLFQVFCSTVPTVAVHGLQKRLLMSCWHSFVIFPLRVPLSSKAFLFGP